MARTTTFIIGIPYAADGHNEKAKFHFRNTGSTLPFHVGGAGFPVAPGGAWDYAKVVPPASTRSNPACTMTSSWMRPPSTRGKNDHTLYTASVFSNDIWLGDNSGESAAFSREVQISGWTSVGDAHGLCGAYVGALSYIPHLLYSLSFSVLTCLPVASRLCPSRDKAATLSPTACAHRYFVSRAFRPCVPELPPKGPLARYCAAFLARRCRALEH
ncbi:hypothetical protein DFH08DRAFT_1090345 [Mycena albidolilacea]|uniref:Uncharacterized protein n=1 Tax=Mycena albidolilacea TaxID=1033008 RepID=A0AAD7E7S1_9AGAR|nr:hypothetical protein DFH08DRAFT_1090345 [Mycena albidolilacea]